MRHITEFITQITSSYMKNFRVQALANQPKAQVYIYGDIGDSWWDDESVTAKGFIDEINALDVEELDVHINSYGGSVSDGLAIYNAMRAHKASVNVHIDGVAMSIATLIAMAGDTVSMAENAIFMVHAPWSYASGNSKDFREQADVLDKYSEAMSTSYARKTGKTQTEILDILTDGQDHYYTAAEALEFGFIDEIAAPISIAASAKGFDLSRFNFNLPLEGNMPQSKKTPEKKAEEPQATTTTVTTETPTPQPEASSDDKAKAFAAANKQRCTDINAAFEPFMNHDGVQVLMNECYADSTIDKTKASEMLLAHLGKDTQPLAGSAVIVTETQNEKFIKGATKAILARAGVEKRESGNPFYGMTLMDLARESLTMAGVNHRGMDKRELVAAAFTQSTSDFPILLENVMHKTLLNAYMLAAFTWKRFCKTGNLSDFRAHNRYKTGSFGNLTAINELGEFTNKAIPDGEKESITAATKGNIINLSRQAIINDDLDAFNGLAAMLGRAAARTVEADVYALLASNPTMSDGVALFHANHGNLAASGGAMSVSTIDAGRVAMASQQDPSGNDYLDIRPSILLCDVAYGGDARVIIDAQYDPDTANKLQRPNKVRGLVSDIVDSPRIGGTAWYLFADPDEAPALEVGFLDGNEDPYLETQDGWTQDGVQMKVRMDYGVAALDYRSVYKNAGS